MRRRARRLRTCVALALATGLLATAAFTARAASTTEVVVDAAHPLGPTNRGLGGFVWNTGPIDGVVPLQPAGIRIDASLQSASRGPDDLDLSALLTRVSEVRRAGAEPLVILSYMPRWLANV